MGLFGSSSNTEEIVKTIRPTVVKTQNVAKELIEIAKKMELVQAVWILTY